MTLLRSSALECRSRPVLRIGEPQRPVGRSSLTRTVTLVGRVGLVVLLVVVSGCRGEAPLAEERPADSTLRPSSESADDAQAAESRSGSAGSSAEEAESQAREVAADQGRRSLSVAPSEAPIGSADRSADGSSFGDASGSRPEDPSAAVSGPIRPTFLSATRNETNERLLDEVKQRLPFTDEVAANGRNPYFFARRFLESLRLEDAEQFADSVHVQSALSIGTSTVPTGEPSCWSSLRAAVGRHRGIVAWGFLPSPVARVVVWLASDESRLDVTYLELRPDPRGPDPIGTIDPETSSTVGESGSWRVFAVERTLEPRLVLPLERVAYQQLDQSEAQPTWRATEAPRGPLLESLEQVTQEMLRDAQQDRLDAVEVRVLTAADRRDTTPRCARRRGNGRLGAAEEQLVDRWVRAVGLDRDLLQLVEIDRHAVVGTTTTFVDTLLVLGPPPGRADGTRRVYRANWRVVRGLYRLAALVGTPEPTGLRRRDDGPDNR